MKLAVIGTGKLARAIVGGLLKQEVFKPEEIAGYARTEKTKEAFLSLSKGLHWASSLEEACQGAGVILIAVKPAQVAEALPQLVMMNEKEEKKNAREPLYISVAAGIRLARFENVLGKPARVIRAMPNTPVLVGRGVTAFTGNEATVEEDLSLAQKIFGAVGHAYRVDEAALDAVTALSGSGPAYFYLFMDCLRKEAEACGLPPEISLEMAARTALGAATLLLETKKSPEDLISEVRSKGGTTEAALKTLQKEKFESACRKAVRAACKRSKELAA